MKGKSVFVGILGAVLVFHSPLYAQTFSSGSTGTDGALEASDWGQNAQLVLQLPESGVFNFTTVDVPLGRVLNFRPNASNTAVVVLAQGDVVIAGTIDVSGSTVPSIGGRVPPGPGGFFGGLMGGDGFGPGGGRYNGRDFVPGRWVGPLSLVPIVGGSGGAGYSSCVGGGGGGAISIASSTSITVSGAIAANANEGNCGSNDNGSGGAIRLVSNSLNVTGYLYANGRQGNPGVIRIEAPAGSRTFSGNASPAAVLSAVNPAIVLPETPTLSIASIAGFAVPSGSGTRPDIVDLLLPTQLVDPIPLVIHASHIPAGSQIKLAINGSPSASATPGTLVGTDLSSTATLSITGLDRTKVIFLFASVTFEVPSLAQAGNPAGPNQVAKLRVDVAPAQESRIAYLRQDGTEVALNHVPASIRQLFGR